MSNLSAQLSAFKNKIRSGPSVTPARRPTTAPLKPQSPTKTNDSTDSLGSKRASGAGDLVTEAIKRQKAAMGGMTGSHLSTQLHLAVEYIKQHDAPVPVSRLQGYLTFDITHTLLPLLKEIDRLKYDADSDTLQYVSLHNIKNSDDLLNFLRVQPTFKGTSVKELKDGWSGRLEAIAEQAHRTTGSTTQPTSETVASSIKHVELISTTFGVQKQDQKRTFGDASP
jgi:transcription initiation factor TFIIE subunit beta